MKASERVTPRSHRAKTALPAHVASRRARRAGLLPALVLGALVLSGAMAAQSPATALAQDAATNAKRLFRDAVGLFKAGEYETAIGVFQRVFEADPNPFVLYNIGRCHEELGELENAAKYYNRALGLGGLPEEARISALRRLEALDEAITARAEWMEGEQEAVHRIERSIKVAREASDDARASSVEPTLAVEPPPVEPHTTPRPPPVRAPASRSRHLTWVGVGTAGVGLIAVGVGFGFASSAREDLDEQQRLIDEYEIAGTAALVRRDPELAEFALVRSRQVNTLANEIEDKQTVAAVLLSTGGSLLLVGSALIAYDLLYEQEIDCSSCSVDIHVFPSLGGVGLGAAW